MPEPTTVLDRVRDNIRDGELPFRAMAGAFAAEAVITRIALEGALELLGDGRADLAEAKVRKALSRMREVEAASTVLYQEGLGLPLRDSDGAANGS